MVFVLVSQIFGNQHIVFFQSFIRIQGFRPWAPFPLLPPILFAAEATIWYA
jgi:hypothetical protein